MAVEVEVTRQDKTMLYLESYTVLSSLTFSPCRTPPPPAPPAYANLPTISIQQIGHLHIDGIWLQLPR